MRRSVELRGKRHTTVHRRYNRGYLAADRCERACGRRVPRTCRQQLQSLVARHKGLHEPGAAQRPRAKQRGCERVARADRLHDQRRITQGTRCLNRHGHALHSSYSGDLRGDSSRVVLHLAFVLRCGLARNARDVVISIRWQAAVRRPERSTRCGRSTTLCLAIVCVVDGASHDLQTKLHLEPLVLKRKTAGSCRDLVVPRRIIRFGQATELTLRQNHPRVTGKRLCQDAQAACYGVHRRSRGCGQLVVTKRQGVARGAGRGPDRRAWSDVNPSRYGRCSSMLGKAAIPTRSRGHRQVGPQHFRWQRKRSQQGRTGFADAIANERMLGVVRGDCKDIALVRDEARRSGDQRVYVHAVCVGVLICSERRRQRHSERHTSAGQSLVR